MIVKPSKFKIILFEKLPSHEFEAGMGNLHIKISGFKKENRG